MGAVYAYGHGSYLPSLDDTPAVGGGTFEDMDGYEYELGVAWKMAPFISAHAGYRMTSIDFTQTDVSVAPSSLNGLGSMGGSEGGATHFQSQSKSTQGAGSPPVLVDVDGDAETKGFFLGLGFHF
jgi:hypothetical protein